MVSSLLHNRIFPITVYYAVGRATLFYHESTNQYLKMPLDEFIN